MLSPAVKSVERALKIIDYLANRSDAAGVREISQRFGYGAGTTQKILNTLHRHGFVEQEPSTLRYEAGFRLLDPRRRASQPSRRPPRRPGAP